MNINIDRQLGVRFELENGSYISIQQNRNVSCDYKGLTSCEVGIFYNDEYDTEDCISHVTPENLVTLLECAIQGKDIPEDLLTNKI